RTLVTIVDLGTFSAAANALHLAQPTISLHVSDLEERLGSALLMRGSRRVQATALGALVIDRARRLLRDADDLLDVARKHVEG
ncbi:helix-turn-helix domain-containing protein, partial [Salmonella enterica]